MASYMKAIAGAALCLGALFCGTARATPAGKAAEIEKRIAELNKQLAELKRLHGDAKARPLELKDAFTWKQPHAAVLSRDGKWFAYSVVGAEGKGETVVRQTAGDKEHRFPGMAVSISFSPDSKWAAVGTLPPGSPAPRAVLLNLDDGTTAEYQGIGSFAFAGEAGKVLALRKVGPASDLVLRELATGKETALGNVAEFAFDKKGDWLALLIEARGQVGNGVQLRNMKTGALHQLESGRASYRSLVWSTSGEAFAALKGTRSGPATLYSLLTFRGLAGKPTAHAFDPAKDPSFPKGMTISPQGGLAFAEGAGAIYFGIAKPGSPGPAAPAAADRPGLIIWHAKQDRLPSQQQAEAGRDLAFSYTCSYRFEGRKFLRLADEEVRLVLVPAKGRYALGLDERATRRSSTMTGLGRVDVHVIDLRTGRRHLALKGMRCWAGTVIEFGGFSPDGTRFLYHSKGHFWAYDMATKTSTCLSKNASARFVDAEFDMNVSRWPTPVIGWTKDSSAVLVSDRWDIWKLPVAEGAAPVNLTRDGLKNGIRYRARLPLGPWEEESIDLTEPLYLSAMEENTKKTGFVRVGPGGSRAWLRRGDAVFGDLLKASDADVFAYTRQSTTHSPDFYVTDASFKRPRRLTDINPQQKQFLWSSGSMLVNYKSARGDALQAALLLPANYEKGKKYPTIVWIYERKSHLKNVYFSPLDGIRAGFTPANYTSNGYAVLMPDITYRLNDPGMSAVGCVLPALDAAVKSGVVDRNKVGLHGHSWGGYQTSFLITQTRAFKAAVAGAPVTNLVSMYNSVYWNTGWANHWHFATGQARITGSFWELPEVYRRNSPMVHARKVQTPLLLLHNDKDGAVDFNQGVEFFNALRRLNKSVIMLQYKGENHGLERPDNQKDYATRMREFFDHHLKGKPAPRWIKDGVPLLEMDEHLTARAGGK